MIHQLKSPKTNKNVKRVGRGRGSKGGHTVGRGQKGQKSRSGYTRPRPGFEGGRMPLSRRIPKLRGFSRGFAKSRINSMIVSLSDLNMYDDGANVNSETLVNDIFGGSKSKRYTIKVVANGDINRKVNLEGVSVTASAKEKIEKSGGSVK